ncbi:MAG TPA: TrpB-like pyridoxal phosphate-dependent enzyme [Chloroflexi bacterium]|nr:TrpB-like pyridoxal phosphate-dependent enzyme [Chloroflexota bacterium]
MSNKYETTRWYNIMADLPQLPAPGLHPVTHQPLTPDDLAALFPMACIEQEVSTQRYINIPEEVQEIYALWRPTPLRRARRLEKMLDTPAKIFYKYEGASPVGSHKPNTAVPQAYYNKLEGVKTITTETGAGQWGSALAMAGAFLDIAIKVYMVRVSYDLKPGRRLIMQSFGATCTPSPSTDTASGRAILAQNPDSPGSLGIAISEAVELALNDPQIKYSLGSVLNHVLIHQSVIGEEAIAQLKDAGAYPDVVIGCIGGGSNFGGIAFPFLGETLREGKTTRFVAVEPAACPKVTKGKYTYDYGDTAGLTPMLKMHTLGHSFVPPAIHAGGLRYHGMAPLVSLCKELGLIEARAYPQLECFDAALQFVNAEGIIAAPETSHAIRAAIDEALDAKEKGEERVILFNFSGHGFLDLSSYQAYLSGDLEDYDYPSDLVEKALQEIPVVA